MVYVDSRVGSVEMADLIGDSIVVSLEYGDAMFGGNGESGEIQIGIERKRWSDLISSFRSGRLVGHQLIGLLDTYQKAYLVCEGIIREDGRTGELQEWRHGKWKKVDYSDSKQARARFSYAAVWKHLITLETKLGVEIRVTPDLRETARMIEVLHEWWSEPWESHKSHTQHRTNVPIAALLSPSKPKWPVQFAANLPGVGWQRAFEIEKHFETVGRMIGASEEEWKQVEGIGKLGAKKIWDALHT